MRTKGATNTLIDPTEPEQIDEVENDARKDEDIPHDAELATGNRTVDGIDLVPVRRNTGHTGQKESRRHCKAVEQK